MRACVLIGRRRERTFLMRFSFVHEVSRTWRQLAIRFRTVVATAGEVTKVLLCARWPIKRNQISRKPTLIKLAKMNIIYLGLYVIIWAKKLVQRGYLRICVKSTHVSIVNPKFVLSGSFFLALLYMSVKCLTKYLWLMAQASPSTIATLSHSLQTWLLQLSLS